MISLTIFGNTLNYADLAVIAIFLIAAVTGFCRGLVISIVNFIRASVGMFLCFYISSNGAQPIYEKYIRQQCLDTINEKIVTTGNIDEVIENLNSFSTSVPKFISDTMNLKSVDISSADIAQSILTGVFEPVALFLTKAVLFIAVFIIFFLSTAIIIRVVRKVNKRKNEIFDLAKKINCDRKVDRRVISDVEKGKYNFNKISGLQDKILAVFHLSCADLFK